ncbi:M23 family metallopeptidase [Mucilaginibacter sp. KACC 22063]|uniref:M23 family metallopeptidase n=1 Tax=Mucilaginibacter sp. KACC 22063 TaxID=3025666 RepID=UPI00236534DA|nr:M23 family metallopeptidase [Mucilaginibacter sp. KACC 22063]WDF54051.1 M23 family metallopeptidase [Mucilaginibacter sp. KACC 22063]
MRIANSLLFIISFLLWLTLQSQISVAQTATVKPITEKPFSFPLQLEMRVPFAPTAFPNGSRYHLLYELQLTNFSAEPVKLRRIDLIDADKKDGSTILKFDTVQLNTMLKPLADNATDKLTLGSGQSAIVFMEATSNINKPFPAKVLHRVFTETDSLQGAIISTRQNKLQVLAPPLEGNNWTAADGPSNDPDNHHRRGVIILNGRSVDSRRYAIDWKKFVDSTSYSGNARDAHDYYCYSEKVYAVADGVIIKATDGLPDNVPGHGKAFHPAVTLTLDRLAGNYIVLDVGNGQYAHYMHLKAGSLKVKAGDHVHKGQLLANIGASGDAREPHLHFEVTSSPKLLEGEGIPYVIESYRLHNKSNQPAPIHKNELPTQDQVVDFAKGKDK